MSKFILAIDQGTTGSTVAIVDKSGKIIAKAEQDHPQIFPKTSWVEHNPDDIWGAVQKSADKAISLAKQAGLRTVEDIAAVGITNQRETVVVWDRKSSKPIYNAIVWQCRRTADFCAKNKKKEKWIQRKTGLVLDPYFSASKVKWILDNVPGARKRAQAGELAMGTMDSYILWKLSNGQTHATDVSNASRTSLMNLQTGTWDKELLKFFSVPESLLPEIRPSSGVFGSTRNLSFLPNGVPIAGIAGDQQSALFGQACFDVGDAKCTYGTGSFLLMNTGKKMVRSRHGLLTTVAWQLSNQKHMTYALEGSAFICGAAVQWLRDNLGMIQKSSEIESLAKQVDSADGVEFVPSFTGLGAPHWDPKAKAAIRGLTRRSNKFHIARACLEGMALQNVDLLVAMEKDLRKKMRNLKVDGGAVENNLLMQIQADYLDRRVIRPKQIETTVLGAAYLAGLGVGFWSSTKDILSAWQVDHIFEVHLTKKERLARLASWNHAVASVKEK